MIYVLHYWLGFSGLIWKSCSTWVDYKIASWVGLPFGTNNKHTYLAREIP